MSVTRMPRYLPVQVDGHGYSIAMDTVLTVQPVDDTEPPHSPAPSAVPVVDLGILFGGNQRQAAHQYAVIVAAPAGRCALLVDGIRSIVSVGQDKVQDLPYLITLTGCPFSAMISVEEEMLPVIDVTRLLEHLRTVRPDLVAEVRHAG